MHSLINSCLKHDDISALLKFPEELLDSDDKIIISEVKNFRQKYGKNPSLKIFSKKYPELSFATTTDPVSFHYDEALKSKRAERIVSAISDIEIADPHDKQTFIDEAKEVITQLVTDLSVSSDRVESYKQFNRKTYFQKSRINLSFGMPLLDSATGGVQSTDFLVIAGKLGSGKSITSQYLTHKWVQEGYRILYISNEASPIQIFTGIDSIQGGFDPLEVRKASRSEKGFASLNGTKDSIKKAEKWAKKSTKLTPKEH